MKTTTSTSDPMSALPSLAGTPATLDDLMRTDGKAELIGGRIIRYMAVGHRPSKIAFRITRSLDDHSELIGHGEAYGDNTGFAISILPSGRQSFSPDASYYVGSLPVNLMRFINGAPIFAAEVRSENDYTPAAEAVQAAKRADYFLAGTLVVWDVDPVNNWIDCYRAADPLNPKRFTLSQEADAEPALPGWRVSVDWLMR